MWIIAFTHYTANNQLSLMFTAPSAGHNRNTGHFHISWVGPFRCSDVFLAFILTCCTSCLPFFIQQFSYRKSQKAKTKLFKKNCFSLFLFFWFRQKRKNWKAKKTRKIRALKYTVKKCDHWLLKKWWQQSDII